MGLDDHRTPTLIEQLRPRMADADPEDYERHLWATRVLAELEAEEGESTGGDPLHERLARP